MIGLLNLAGLRRMPMIMQAEKTECALACLAMVLGWFGHRLTLFELRNSASFSQRGTSLKNLMQVADRHHLVARPLRLECDEVKKLSLPAILHWDLDHYVVLTKVSGGNLTVHDPAIGIRKISVEELNTHFTGVALELMPGSGFEPKKQAPALRIRDLWNRSTGLGTALSELLLLSLLLQIFALGLPFYTQLFIDDVLVNSDWALLKVLACGFFLIAVVKSVTELLRSWAVLYLSNKLSFQFAANVFRHLLHLPLDYFSRRHMGDILSRFGSLNKIRDFLSSGIVEVLIDGLMVCGTLVLMFIYSSMLTWVALVAVGLYLLIRTSVHNEYHMRSEESIHTSARENSQFMENIRAIQGIKLFGKEQDRMTGWQHYYADVINAGARLQRLGINIRFVSGLLVGVENIVLMLLGGYAVLNQQLSMGMIIAYLSFKDQFYGRVFALIDKLFEFRLLRLHLDRLADIALTETESHRHGFGLPKHDVCLKGGLKGEGLGFRYSDDSPWLFRNLDIEVGQNECVAIVGPTGCGKSTLLRILLSLNLPTEGRVTLFDVPVQAMGLSSFRERVSAVLQDDSLLTGSILDNITFFDPQPDRERVEYVAHLASLARDIRTMPLQYDTLVGSMGTALSGGQIQRLLLARALYKQPQLLVLDEATSHLDVATERNVNAAIRQMNIARVIVAHRPQTILQADRILRLEPEGLVAINRSDLEGVMKPAREGVLTL